MWCDIKPRILSRNNKYRFLRWQTDVEWPYSKLLPFFKCYAVVWSIQSQQRKSFCTRVCSVQLSGWLPVSKSINQSINRSIDRSINQLSINQSKRAIRCERIDVHMGDSSEIRQSEWWFSIFNRRKFIPFSPPSGDMVKTRSPGVRDLRMLVMFVCLQLHSWAGAQGVISATSSREFSTPLRWGYNPQLSYNTPGFLSWCPPNSSQ